LINFVFIFIEERNFTGFSEKFTGFSVFRSPSMTKPSPRVYYYQLWIRIECSKYLVNEKYTYWIDDWIDISDNCFQVSPKISLTPGKKGSLSSVSTWWHKCSLSSAKFLKYI
jgi:hypothetical protein